MFEIGRINIVMEVSKLSSFLTMPQNGHLHAACHIMSYLKHKHNSRLMMVPSPPLIKYSHFHQDWTGEYDDVSEALPLNAPKELESP